MEIVETSEHTSNKILGTRSPVLLEFDLPSGVLQSRKRIYSLADVKVPIPPRASLKIIRGLAEGIDYLHHQGVRHYLLEPSVVLLDKGLNPKISGFDAAALVQSYIPEDCWIIALSNVTLPNAEILGKRRIFIRLERSVITLSPARSHPLTIIVMYCPHTSIRI